MNKDAVRQIGVIVSTFAVISGYLISFIIPGNGGAIGALGEKYIIYFVPTSFTFSIWIIIFLGLTFYSIYQALPAQKENQFLRNIGWWYIGGILSLMSWRYFWQYQHFLFSMLTMSGLLVSLIIIYKKLNIGMAKESRGMRFFVYVPFSIFLGWVTISTIANISQYLMMNGWNGFGIEPKIWAVVLMVVVIVIAEFTAFNRQDLVYLAVIDWAFIGIAVKHKGISPVFEAACVAAGIVIIMAVITLIVKAKIKRHT